MSKCTKCGNEILTGDIHWEMGLCNNCYNELYKDHKTYISLDKMWLNIAQRFRDENEKLQDKVADLEAKLAKYEKFMKDNEWDSVEEMQETLNKCEKKYFDIQKQLAEKEKEIKDLEKEVDDWCHKIMKQGTYHSLELSKAREKANQDKISFALEQLKKVKELLYPELCFDYSLYLRVMHEIDNQIKQLKEIK